VNFTVIGSVLAAILTLMVFSYLLGNNPLYRLAQHIFVGVALGYATLLLLGNVLIPRVLQVASNPTGLNALLVGLPILLGLFLLVRLIRPGVSGALAAPLAVATIALNIALSTVAALAIAGALTGTLIPQAAGTMLPLTVADPLVLLGNLVIIVGVLISLYYFQFSTRSTSGRAGLSLLVAESGRWLIVVALGATLGSLLVSFVTTLAERVQFLFGVVNLFT